MKYFDFGSFEKKKVAENPTLGADERLGLNDDLGWVSDFSDGEGRLLIDS